MQKETAGQTSSVADASPKSEEITLDTASAWLEGAGSQLLDLAVAVAPEARHEIIGIRAGEKLHEELVTLSDAINTISYSNKFVILPNSEYLNWNREQYIQESDSEIGMPCHESFSYDSKNNPSFLTVDELRKLVTENVPGGAVLTS